MARPGSVVISAGDIAAGVERLAAEVAAVGPAGDASLPLVLLCVLKGALLLTADLARALDAHGVEVEIDAVLVRSYAGTEQTGRLEVIKDAGTALGGRDVLIVEDVVDTGLTTAFLLDRVRADNPARLRLLALLDKPGRRLREVAIDHCGFRIGDDFVVGYGLDLDERWRQLPDVRALDGPPG